MNDLDIFNAAKDVTVRAKMDASEPAPKGRPPKETHLHVVMHPDIKAALKKLAELDRRKMAEIARDLIVSGLRQRGIDL